MSNPHHLHQLKIDAKATKENRYPQGYLPKIQYWAEVLYNACEDNDIEDMDRAKARLDYFCARQRQAYSNGSVTSIA